MVSAGSGSSQRHLVLAIETLEPPKKQAVLGVTGDDRWAVDTAFERTCTDVEAEGALRLVGPVTLVAVLFQDGLDVGRVGGRRGREAQPAPLPGHAPRRPRGPRSRRRQSRRASLRKDVRPWGPPHILLQGLWAGCIDGRVE